MRPQFFFMRARQSEFTSKKRLMLVHLIQTKIRIIPYLDEL